MYVNPFWFGFWLGCVTGIVGTILWLITLAKIKSGGKQ